MSPPNLGKDLKNVAVLGAVNPKRLRIDIWSKQGYLDGHDIQACAGAMKRNRRLGVRNLSSDIDFGLETMVRSLASVVIITREVNSLHMFLI